VQCPRCQRENRPDATFCDGCGTPLKHSSASTQPAPSYADVQSSLAESLTQQTATSEILGVISRSQTDVHPVFEAIAANALRLCGAKFSLTACMTASLFTSPCFTTCPRRTLRQCGTLFRCHRDEVAPPHVPS